MVFYVGLEDIDGITVLLSLEQELAVAVVDQDFVGATTRLAEKRLEGFRSVKVRQGQPYHPEQIFDQCLASLIHVRHRPALGHDEIKHFNVTEERFLVLRLLEQTPALHVMRVHQERGIGHAFLAREGNLVESLFRFPVSTIDKQQIAAAELSLNPVF